MISVQHIFHQSLIAYQSPFFLVCNQILLLLLKHSPLFLSSSILWFLRILSLISLQDQNLGVWFFGSDFCLEYHSAPAQPQGTWIPSPIIVFYSPEWQSGGCFLQLNIHIYPATLLKKDCMSSLSINVTLVSSLSNIYSLVPVFLLLLSCSLLIFFSLLYLNFR